MSALIKDLLAYSRVNTRVQPPGPVNCQIVLNTVLQNLRLQIAETGTRVTNDPLPTVLADEGQVTQVFQNLVSNAIKFRHPGRPPEIHIRAEQNENQWLFAVRDNGIGIDKRFYDRIFVIFQRLNANREKFPGTGIGLAIVKRIIDRQGGRIWVESRPGEGSTFYFTVSKGDFNPILL
jgi:light-regulated signal transduction histidine kinase (bacteriophytochrome)